MRGRRRRLDEVCLSLRLRPFTSRIAICAIIQVPRSPPCEAGAALRTWSDGLFEAGTDTRTENSGATKCIFKASRFALLLLRHYFPRYMNVWSLIKSIIPVDLWHPNAVLGKCGEDRRTRIYRARSGDTDSWGDLENLPADTTVRSSQPQRTASFLECLSATELEPRMVSDLVNHAYYTMGCD